MTMKNKKERKKERKKNIDFLNVIIYFVSDNLKMLLL